MKIQYRYWRVDLWTLGLVVFTAYLTSHAQSDDVSQAPPSAPAVMRQAHEGRAVWRDFSGFRANLKATADGKVLEGTLQVGPTGSLELNLPADDQFAWVKSTLQSVVNHRLSRDEAIEHVSFADDQVNHPLGRLLKSTDDGDNSLWRVKGDVLTEVHRFQEKSHFVITVMDVARNPEGKNLPKAFNVTTWDTASDRLTSNRQVFNEWLRVGKTDLPVKLLAVSSKDEGVRRVEQIELTNLDLLPNATTATK